MSVSEADMMTVLGETQEVSLGARQEEYAAAVARQYAYEAEQRADFGTPAHEFPLAAVPFVTGAALGALTSFNAGGGGGVSSALSSWQDPQVNFPRGERIYVPGTEPPPPGTRLPVPYEPPPQPGPFAFGIGGIGAILGGVIAGMWEGWPNALGSEEGLYDTRAPSASPEVILSGPDFGDVAAGPVDTMGPPSSAGDNPPYPTFPTPYGGDAGSSVDPNAGPVPESVLGPPQGARQPAPAPAQPTLPPWVWPLIGGLGAIQLGRAGRGSRSSQTVPFNPVVDLTVVNEPLLPSPAAPGFDPLTPGPWQAAGPLTSSGSAWDGELANDGCNCSPRKSGKKRKCLARAQLSWRSGPKKGKPAGSRCIRFQND